MGKNSIIIYKSKTGFAKRFAKWIGEELDCDIIPYEKRNTIDLQKYDTIIYGGGIYAGGINGLKWLKEKLPALTGKKVIVFASGASPADSPEASKCMRGNFTLLRHRLQRYGNALSYLLSKIISNFLSQEGFITV